MHRFRRGTRALWPVSLALLVCVALSVEGMPWLDSTAAASEGAALAAPPALNVAGAESAAVLERAAEVEAYWTPERMREASSLDGAAGDQNGVARKSGARGAVGARSDEPHLQDLMKTVGVIFMRSSDGADSVCTGFSVAPALDGSGIIETAAHCVIDDKDGLPYEYVLFVPGWDGDFDRDSTVAPYGKFAAVDHVSGWDGLDKDAISMASPEHDWGFYKVLPSSSGNLLPSTVGWVLWDTPGITYGEELDYLAVYYNRDPNQVEVPQPFAPEICSGTLFAAADMSEEQPGEEQPGEEKPVPLGTYYGTGDCIIPAGASGGAALRENRCTVPDPANPAVEKEIVTFSAIGVLSQSDDGDLSEGLPPITQGPLHTAAVDKAYSELAGYPEYTDPPAGGGAVARSASRASGDVCAVPAAVVSMGDSYISGEGGRWAGNANTWADGSVWGTDRAAVNCDATESACDHDPSRVYGNTGYDLSDQACDRSDSAEIRGAVVPGVPVERRFNLACSGAKTEHVTSSTFKGQPPQVEQLREIARRHHVRVVVLSVGGNDLEFSELLQECATAYFLPSAGNNGCRGSKERAFSEALDPTRAKIVQTIDAIRQVLRDAGQADGSYQVVLQSYPNPLPLGADYRDPESSSIPGQNYNRYLKGGCPFLDADSDWAHTSVVPRISAMLHRAATEAGVSFLDLKDAFAGHELCTDTARQATSSDSLSSPLSAQDAEWVRWVPYLNETTKDVPWHAQGHLQEAIHPNYFGQLALSACLTKVLQKLGTTPAASACVGQASSPPESVEESVDRNPDLGAGNRRGPVPGLPDWSKAGYRGGQSLPSSASYTSDPACHLTPSALGRQFGVRADDGQDDTAGIQRAIDQIREECTPRASSGKLSVIQLPRGVLEVSKQLGVDASYLVIRGQGVDAGGTRLVFRPDTTTRYDVLTPKNERWAQERTDYTCQRADRPPQTASGGWIWPGRGLFRVQTREIAERYFDRCDFTSIPANRRDLFEGSINQHWDSGVTLAGASGDTNYAARQGGKVIQLNAKADMSRFQTGGYLWVGAANSLKFYQSQGVSVTGPDDSRLDNLHMRQQVFMITSVDASRRTVTIDAPLQFDVPVDSTSDGSPPLGSSSSAKPYASKVTPLKMITDVGFENFSFTQDLNGLPKLTGGTYQLSPSQAVHNYGNMAPEYAMHGVVFKWAANSWMRGVRAEMTGSHPVVTEVAKNIQIQNNVFDGSWNKGKGGNGYIRGSRVWDSLYAFNTSRNLRHFTFQWAASGNVAIGNDFDSDLNLHGGWEQRNLFENNTVRIPHNHSSGECDTNCGGEGGNGDVGTWWPIYWAAGNKGIGWSGSSGPQNVFFRNTLTKQLTPGGPYRPYYDDPARLFQFGSAESDPSIFHHLTLAGSPLPDWGGAENISFIGNGVNASQTDAAPSLFLQRYRP